jgi:hypothetical protein
VAKTNTSNPEARAQARVKEYTDLMWHTATFVIINGFMWLLDFGQGGGLDWAFWLTIFWGIGFAFHIAAYLFGNAGQSRRYQKYLAEEQSRTDG